MLATEQITRFHDWISTKTITPCTSDSLYDEMESQSGYGLPVIYQPFDLQKRGHWRDVGLIMDFLHTTDARGGRVLDFGPGDGWPSLMLAPFVREVVGVDASAKRVEVCRANAARMGISNAQFMHYTAGTRLPFEDGSFDAVVAASSLEQSPNPKEMLRELHRVLRPGGRLRMYYEGLARYATGQETELWLMGGSENDCTLVVYLRDIPGECATQYLLGIALAEGEVRHLLGGDTDGKGLLPLLHALGVMEPAIVSIRTFVLRHPSCRTWMRWLGETGFTEVSATHDGGTLADQLFERLGKENKELSLEEATDCILQILPFVSRLEAPVECDPMILAVK